MRTTVLILAVITAARAEAPYHLPRPNPNLPSFNYNYQQHHHHSQPLPIQPLPAPLPPIQYAPAPQPNYIQNSGYQYQQPNIGLTFVQSQPQPLPAYLPPRPVQVNHQFVHQPSPTYGSPLLRQPAPIPQQQQPFLVPQPSPALIQHQGIQQPIAVSQYQGQNGYSYSGPQFINQTPLSYNTQQSSFTSYQADSNAYARTEAQREPLDSTVVDRVQSILKDNEHTSAKSAGYLSLVSGVSLEAARPSVEISSFVHNSPLSQPSVQEFARSSAQSSTDAAARSPSQGYGLPTITVNNAQSGQSQSNFLPQTQASTTYGVPS